MQRFLFLICLSLYFFFGCGLFISPPPNDDSKEKDKKEEKKKTEEAVPIRITKVKKGSISNYIEASSTIETKYYVDVYPKISEKVIKIYKEEGMSVTEGDLLAELESTSLQLEKDESQLLLEELKHQLNLQKVSLQETIKRQQSEGFQVKELLQRFEDAQNKSKQTHKDFERSQTMRQKNLISEETFEDNRLKDQESQFALKMAELSHEKAKFDLQTQSLLIEKANIELQILENKIQKAALTIKKADIRLQDTKMKAPISGIISHKDLQVGQMVQPAHLAFSIIDGQNLEVKLGIPERELSVIRKNQPVILFNETVPLQEETKPQGEISSMSPVVQKETGTVKITVRILPEFVSAFKPGMFVTTQIITSTHENATLIPKKSLLFDDNIPFVFLLTPENRAQKVLLRKENLGFKNKFYYEVLDLIQPTDSIIVVGQSGLKENTRVQVVSEENN